MGLQPGLESLSISANRSSGLAHSIRIGDQVVYRDPELRSSFWTNCLEKTSTNCWKAKVTALGVISPTPLMTGVVVVGNYR